MALFLIDANLTYRAVGANSPLRGEFAPTKNHHGMTFTYPLARYRFEFEVTAPTRLPEYAGSTLRGAFGHAPN